MLKCSLKSKLTDRTSISLFEPSIMSSFNYYIYLLYYISKDKSNMNIFTYQIKFLLMKKISSIIRA